MKTGGPMATLNRRRFSQALVMSGSVSLLGRSAGAAERTEAPGQAREGSLTDVEGIKVGHFTDSRRPTGCTAMIFEEEAAVGVDYDGSAPGETQVVLLQPVSPIERVHAIFFTGGGPMG